MVSWSYKAQASRATRGHFYLASVVEYFGRPLVFGAGEEVHMVN